ncbi:MAG: sigma-E processing peptidase SpoIIGA [Syntrophomonadaceae bacterium]
MSEPRVYADLTFIVNVIMDFSILWATGKLAGIKLKYYRIFLASIIGGGYAVGYLFVQLAWLYSFPLKILFSCLLLMFSFWPIKWEQIKASFLYFYGISFAVAGATVGSSYLFNNHSSVTFSSLYLLGGIFCALFIGLQGEKYLKEQIIPGLLKHKVKLCFGNITCYGEGFLDTGNGLHDPLTNRPVLIAEYKWLKKFLPDDVKAVLETVNNEAQMLDALASTSWAHRLRLIPFTSIGRKNGLLVGVRADKIEIDAGRSNFTHKNIVVGIYRDNLTTNGDYQLLIPSGVLKKG